MSNINTVFTFNNGVPTGFTAHITSTGALHTTDNTNPNWDTLLDAIRKDDVKMFTENIDVRAAFETYVEGNVKVVGSEVHYGNVKLHGVVVDRIFDFMKNNLPVRPMLRFIDKLYKNPSARSVNELYNFLAHKKLPIVSNGNFRAYKGLMSDSYSVTGGSTALLQGKVREDGRIFNGVGETIECMRNSVNDNKDDTCSYGLHAGSYEYASNFSQGKLVEVEIDPSDVVSIPSDCSGQKLRTCKYVVVAESIVPMNDTYIQTESDDCGDDCGDECGDECENCGNDYCDCDCDTAKEQAYLDAFQLGVADGITARRNGDGDFGDPFNPTHTERSERYHNYKAMGDDEMVECYVEGYHKGFYGKN